jgi:serine protease
MVRWAKKQRLLQSAFPGEEDMRAIYRSNAKLVQLKVTACNSIVGGVLALALSFTGAQAATFTVPGSSATIQGAILLAAAGDTILVSPGTYPEAINFLGKNLTLRSVGGPTVTTIAAPPMATVVLFVSSEGPAAVLDGFTISGGNPGFTPPNFGSGGGVYIYGASPTISNNIIAANSASTGGGIQVSFGSPVLTGNTFSDNHATSFGGGVSLGGNGTAVVSSNLFTGNVAGSGSAIGMFAAGAPRIFGNAMTGNMATDGDCRVNGGTIWMVNQSDADIVQNVIDSNEAVCSGGVVFLVPSGDRGPALINNTIVLNGGAASSGIYAEGFDAASRLINNVVLARPGLTAMGCGTIYATAPPIMKNNVFSSSGGTTATNFCAAQIGVNGNISSDPQLLAPATGDYRLLPSSPAIDAGDGSDPLMPVTDFAGALRVQDGNGDGIAVIDMGAFEAPPPPLPAVLVTPVPVGSPPWLVVLTGLLLLMAAQLRKHARR